MPVNESELCSGFFSSKKPLMLTGTFSKYMFCSVFPIYNVYTSGEISFFSVSNTPFWLIGQLKMRFPFKSLTCKVVGLSSLNFPLNCSPPSLHRGVVLHKSNNISESQMGVELKNSLKIRFVPQSQEVRTFCKGRISLF